MSQNFFADSQIDKYIKDNLFEVDFKGTMIEVGGGHPENISMSRLFRLSGWSVYVIEPNPDLVKLHDQMGNTVFDVACLDVDKDEVSFTIVTQGSSSLSCSSVSPKESYMKVAGYTKSNVKTKEIKVKQKTLDTILSENNIKSLDLLTVDVEGYEIDVMRGLTILRPKVVVLENIFDDIVYHNYMGSINYEMHLKKGENHIYIKK